MPTKTRNRPTPLPPKPPAPWPVLIAFTVQPGATHWWDGFGVRNDRHLPIHIIVYEVST